MQRLKEVNKLLIDANFNVGAARDISRPDEYDVTVKSVGRKGAGDLASSLNEVLSICIVLEQTGLGDWVRSKAYDALWTYLRSFLYTVSDGQHDRDTSLAVHDHTGTERILIQGIRFQDIDSAKITIEEAIEEKAGSAEWSGFSVCIDISNDRT